MEKKLIDDISTLTNIPKSRVEDLFVLMENCMCDYVLEDRKELSDITEIDLLFGTLIVGRENNSIKYKFIPSLYFENKLREALITNKNPLTSQIESKLSDKMLSVYKELLY